MDRTGGLHPTVGQHQHVGEAVRDLLDVVGDEHDRRGAGVDGQRRQRGDELLASAEVEPGRRLVEQQQLGRGHQGAGQQHALALARRQQDEALVGHRRAAHLLEQRAGAGPVGVVVGVPPRFERAVAGGHDDLDGRELATEAVGQRRAGQPDAGAERADVGAAQLLAEHVDGSRRRVQVERGDADQRGLARAVAAEHDPPLAGTDHPVDLVEDRALVSDQRHAGQVEHGIRNRSRPKIRHGHTSARIRTMTADVAEMASTAWRT